MHDLCPSTQGRKSILRRFLQGATRGMSILVHRVHTMGLYRIKPFSGCPLMQLHPICQHTTQRSGCLVCRLPIPDCALSGMQCTSLNIPASYIGYIRVSLAQD